MMHMACQVLAALYHVQTMYNIKQAAARKLTFKEKAELAGIEDAIGAAEAKVAELESTLSDPSVFKDRPTEVQTLIASLDAARVEVERLFARWQELDAIPKE